MELGPFARTCNPSKWEADIWGWLEVRRSAMLHFNERQRPHWACQQYGHWGNRGMARCQEMSTLPARYIPQRSDIGKQQWVTGFHGVWSVVGWLIVYQDGDYLYPCQYSQTICRLQIGWYHLCSGNILIQGPVHFWKAGSGEIMTVENLFIYYNHT